MKLMVIGLGRCGGRVADAFSKLNWQSKLRRRVEIVSGSYAANTRAEDLIDLENIKADYRHRILLGARLLEGAGVDGDNKAAARIMSEESDKVIGAFSEAGQLYGTDAFMVVAATSGGTGSGMLPVLTQYLKERFIDKPVYNLLVLPTAEEEADELVLYNTATCLKSAHSVADAVFLFDNQRFVNKNLSVSTTFSEINQMIVAPFNNLLCAGEEKNPRYIGNKLVDAGDIIQTLSGWTVIGHGEVPSPLIGLPFHLGRDFRKLDSGTGRGMSAMERALAELSLRCNPADAHRAIFFISSSARELSVDMIKEIGDYIRNLSPVAVIRDGDYPRSTGKIGVTLIFSQLDAVEKIRNYYRAFSTIGKEPAAD